MPIKNTTDLDAPPYINHPIGVACPLADVSGASDIDTRVAALLHDTIEDTETTAAELEELLGRTVREVVEEVTDDKSKRKEVLLRCRRDERSSRRRRADL